MVYSNESRAFIGFIETGGHREMTQAGAKGTWVLPLESIGPVDSGTSS
jgi:hypothetical protein